MLEEAHLLREQGHDVVLDFVKTHGRAETAARIGDLEARPAPRGFIPQREPGGHGCPFWRASPSSRSWTSCAHAPGSRHSKRYQDVEELVGNCIKVIAAFDV